MGYRYSDREIRIAEWLRYKWTVPKGPGVKFADPCWYRDGKPTPTGGIPHTDTDDGALSILPMLDTYYVIRLESSDGPLWRFTMTRDGVQHSAGYQESISDAISETVLKVVYS